VRNWDYRYCWLRDATLTLLALMNAGYYEEATAWRNWLLRAIAGSPQDMQIMYGVAGERRLTEWEVTWLPGYESSRPVRVGNEAYAQLQIDVFALAQPSLWWTPCGHSHIRGCRMSVDATICDCLLSLATGMEQP
jgi:GH15 family glucan-1,4-alpha-glucosidase